LAWRIGVAKDKDIGCDLAWLPNHVSHIGVLLMCLDLWTMARILSALGNTFPRLSRVQLEIDSASAIRVWTPGVFPAFKAGPPDLTNLDVSYVSVNVDLFANLTSLILQNLFYTFDHFSCSAVQLLELLRRSPRLETLNLTGIGIRNPKIDEVDPPVVELAYLQFCNLSDLEIIMWLLDHLHIPASASIIRDIDDEWEDEDADLDPDRWEHSQLDISIGEWEILFGRQGVAIPICIRPHINTDLFAYIPKLVTTFDFASMPDLTISQRRGERSHYPHPPGVAIWTEFLSRLPSLTMLDIVVEWNWVDNLLIALFTEVSSSHARLTRGSAYLCRGLEVLRIEVIPSVADWDIVQAGTGAGAPGYGWITISEANISRLELRQQRLGGALQYLGVSFGDEGFLRRLRGFVKEVEHVVRMFVLFLFLVLFFFFVCRPSLSGC
jgi:hypothetical protein